MSSIKITAKSEEEFRKINELLETLPKAVTAQITHAETHVGSDIRATLTPPQGDSQRYQLPKDVYDISVYPEKFSAHCKGISFVGVKSATQSVNFSIG